MIYFIYGEEQFFIKQETNQLVRSFSSPNHSRFYFNEESSLDEIINELSNFSLFEPNKIIVISNFFLIEKEDPKKTNFFLNLLQNINDNYEIIFSFLVKKKINLKNKLNQFLINNANSKKIKKASEKEIPNLVFEILKNKNQNVKKSDIYYFCSKLPNDLMIIESEINKLIDSGIEFNKENIDKIVTEYSSKSNFDFINAINEKNVETIFSVFKRRYEEGESIINLISQISSTLSLANLVNRYKDSGYNLKQISDKEKIHIYRLEIANKLLIKIGLKRIVFLLNKLAELDYEIKSGILEEKIGFENLLLLFIK